MLYSIAQYDLIISNIIVIIRNDESVVHTALEVKEIVTVFSVILLDYSIITDHEYLIAAFDLFRLL